MFSDPSRTWAKAGPADGSGDSQAQVDQSHIVDDIVHNVAPKYQGDVTKLTSAENEADIRRILKAFSTDSKVQRERLVAVLKNTRFVLAVDTGDRRKWWAIPGKLYLATERLKELFAGVPGVLLVDDTLTYLRGEEIRQLLEDCGATRYFRLQSDSSLPWEERGRLREKSGHAEISGYSDQVEDFTLAGLNPLLDVFPTLTNEQRRNKARFLWEEIISLEERRGKAVFTGTYKWSHHGKYQIEFDAAFIRKLNQADWVPTQDGQVERPEFVQFDTLAWKPDPFLQSKIQFKPPIIDSLAREAGIEPGVLDLLKKLGVTTVAELRGKLGIPAHETAPEGSGATPSDVDKAVKDILGGDKPGPTSPVPGPTAEYSHGASAGGGQPCLHANDRRIVVEQRQSLLASNSGIPPR